MSHLLRGAGVWWAGAVRALVVFVPHQMEVIVGDFGIVVVPRDGADTERIMNHSSVLRKHTVRVHPNPFTSPEPYSNPNR